MSAGNSLKQEIISACANIGNKSVADLLTTCKATAFGADDDDKSKYVCVCVWVVCVRACVCVCVCVCVRVCDYTLLYHTLG